MDIEYEVEFGYEEFRRMLAKINGFYIRRTRIVGLACTAIWDALCLSMLLDSFSRNALGFEDLLSIVLTLAAFTFLFVWPLLHPSAAIGTRRAIARGWFDAHGCPNAEDGRIKELRCHYRVQLADNGYTLAPLYSDSARIPWLLFSDRPIYADGILILCTRTKKEMSSLMKGSWGIPMSMAQGVPLEEIVVPAEVLKERPDLPQKMTEAVQRQTEQFIAARQAQDRAWAENLASWLKAV
ncbi:MAG: hypothetical protein ACI361_09715 [Atopobiaceae bacterium]